MKVIVSDQKVKVKWGTRNKEYFESIKDEKGFKKYEFTFKNDLFDVDVEDLNKGSKSIILCKCDNCKNIFERKAQVAFRANLHFCNKECNTEYVRENGSLNKSRIDYECDYCNKSIEVKKYVYKELKEGNRKNIFCSRICQGKWNSENKTGKNNPCFNSTEVKCSHCNSMYYVPYGRVNKTKYCSDKCRRNSKRNRIKYNCEYCNEECYKTPSQMKKTKNHFCSHKCADAFRSESLREDRKCEYCNDVFNVRKSLKQRFCSMKCQSKWQSEYLIGENANNFNKDIPIKNRIIDCEWCKDKTIVKSPYKLKLVQEQKSKHFCSINCKQEWYAKDWSQNDEWRRISSERAVKMLEKGTLKTDTWCQKEINNILDDLNIKYKNEYNCKYVSIDNYLIDYDLMIEVMGTYWHTDHRIYKKINYQMQVDRIKNDKIKNRYIKSQYGIDILYLWEEDIKENPELVVDLIRLYINNKGKLKNYHSFNYLINGGILTLKNTDDIKFPYMEYDIEELRNIIKLKEKTSKKQLDKWIVFNCDFCGKEKERLISHYKNSKTHCCSRECSHRLRKANK